MHIIEFPGGAIELSRLDDGSYWAHIMVNRDEALEGCEGLRCSLADVVDARIDRDFPGGVQGVEDCGSIQQVAVRIRNRSIPSPTKDGGEG